jgi:hypothetical protein
MRLRASLLHAAIVALLLIGLCVPMDLSYYDVAD